MQDFPRFKIFNVPPNTTHLALGHVTRSNENGNILFHHEINVEPISCFTEVCSISCFTEVRIHETLCCFVDVGGIEISNAYRCETCLN